MSLYLGIDLSTQSVSACVYDSNKMEVVSTVSVAFGKMSEIANSPMDKDSLLIVNNGDKSEQDPMIFLVALDKMLANLGDDFTSKVLNIADIKAIQFSAQQHGHVYLNDSFEAALNSLDSNADLWASLANTFSYKYAPIWRSSDTVEQANALRESIGGKEAMIKTTGSDSPLRFSGAVVKKVFEADESVAKNTKHVMLISNYLAAVFSSNVAAPIDFGNGSGMSLMDYSKKQWDKTLLDCVSTELKSKLADIASSLTVAGNIGQYFVNKYGFDKNCKVGIGTGDNPATKVISQGDLLSLGTSFVYMKNTSESDRDYSGVSNAMYDGLDNPFTILCRTNGAMIWDKISDIYSKDYKDFHDALVAQRGKYPLSIWQIEKESVPLSQPVERENLGNFDEDCKALTLSNLALIEQYTSSIFSENTVELSVTGGPTKDEDIVQIIAELWNCPVHILPTVGASLGAAFMAMCMSEKDFDIASARKKLITKTVVPKEQDRTLVEKYKILLKEMIKSYLL